MSPSVIESSDTPFFDVTVAVDEDEASHVRPGGPEEERHVRQRLE